MMPYIRFVFGLVIAVGASGSVVCGCKGSTTDNGASTSVSSILFVKRAYSTGSGETITIDVASGKGEAQMYGRYVPGGGLYRLTPPRIDGQLVNLTAQFTQADIEGPVDVSFDATMATFSMKTSSNDLYHIYTVSLTGSPIIHQLTGSNANDYGPVFLPNGRIAFFTDEAYTAMGHRADEYNHAGNVTQIATVSIASGDADRKLFPQNQSHVVTPFLMNDGRVGFVRWEHFNNVNDMKLFAANPDGTNVIAVAGQHGKPANSLLTPRSLSNTSYQFIGISGDRDTLFSSGSLAFIDARNHGDANCLNDTADHTGHQCLDEEHVTYSVLSPPASSVPTGQYMGPSMLPNGCILSSWAPGSLANAEITATAPKFQIVMTCPTSPGSSSTNANQIVYVDNNFYNMSPVPVIQRTPPPVIANLQATAVGIQAAVIGSINISDTDLSTSNAGTALPAALQAACGVHVVEGFGTEALNCGGVAAYCGASFGYGFGDGAALIGDPLVRADGSWLAMVPPYLPMHLYPYDKFYLGILSQPLWMQSMPGESRVCSGCHEPRTRQAAPSAAAQTTGTLAAQVGAQNYNVPISSRRELFWPTQLQPIFDSQCAPCHNATTTTYYTVGSTVASTGVATVYQLPYLDLSNTPMDAYGVLESATSPTGVAIDAGAITGQYSYSAYSNGNQRYIASYVSLLAPAGFIGQTRNAVVTGAYKYWITPSNARTSALIQKINMPGINCATLQPDGTWAWPTPPHPEDQNQGYSLTIAQRQTLALMADMGGQYFARQQGPTGTPFVPYSPDPTLPSP